VVRPWPLVALFAVACSPAAQVGAPDLGPDAAPAADAAPDGGLPCGASRPRPDGCEAPDAAPPPDAAATDATTGDAAETDAAEADAAETDAAVLDAAADAHVPADAAPATDAACEAPLQGEDAAVPVDPGPPSACGGNPETADVVRFPNRGANHVAIGTCVTYADNPPASGPHYGRWAPAGVYAEPVDRRYWVHNLEHGWLVLLYRPDADARAIADLRAAMDALPGDPVCPDLKKAILTPDPLLDAPVAAVAWNRALKGDHLSVASIQAFFAACRDEAPELRVCADGG
jgi:hypothetical protein